MKWRSSTAPQLASDHPLLSVENASVRFPDNSAHKRTNTHKKGLLQLAHNSAHSFRTKPVLEDLWLDMRGGNRVGLVGPNGSGKSTFLRLLAGAIPPASGRIFRTGRTIAILSAQAGLEMNATGYENIFLRGLLLGVKLPEIRAAMDDIIEFSGLEDRLQEPVRTYSAGMVLRLAFSISTAFPADILLIDEWIGTGDAAFIGKAKARLSDMVSNTKILVVASHNESVIRTLCTEAIFMLDGRIAHHGAAESTFAVYNSWLQTQKTP